MSASITVRMYNQKNLGDCFLLKFSEGEQNSYLLIDCGSYVSGNQVREKEIAQSISDTVGKNPLTIVLTHQHKDHLTGFISAADIFEKMNIKEVWFSFLDDPGPEGQKIRAATEKFWNKNKENKEAAKTKFKGNAKVEAMLAAKDALDLFAEEQKGGEAISNLLKWSKNKCRFLFPGENFIIEPLSDKSVRTYVLGPPTDPTLLQKLNPSKEDSVHSLNSLSSVNNFGLSAQLIGDALENSKDKNFPFSKKFQQTDSELETLYKGDSTDWRKIDYDWLSELGGLSLHMDNLTNNSSLVLAFELVESKKVALFVGDAQIGNWKSWFDVKFKDSTITAQDLLRRTVLYKAGHHSSHNATLKQGLDLMNEEELLIMIPVNLAVSDNMGFSMMCPGMLEGYNRKSKGRVVRADTVFQGPTTIRKKETITLQLKNPFIDANSEFSKKIKVVEDDKKETHLYIEYVVE